MPLMIHLVEDSPGDVRLTQEAFREVNREIHVNVGADGFEASAFLAFETLVEGINDFWLTRARLPERSGG